MKTLMIAILALLLAICIACGGGSTNGVIGGTPITGTWTVTTSQTGFPNNNTLQATLVLSGCQVDTPVGTFSMSPENCFLADNYSGQGSVAGPGPFFYPPRLVLVGSTWPSIPRDKPITLGITFVEADQDGNVAQFDLRADVTNGTMTGTWICGSPACTWTDPQGVVHIGMSGTFLSDHFKSGQQLSLQNRPTGVAVQD